MFSWVSNAQHKFLNSLLIVLLILGAFQIIVLAQNDVDLTFNAIPSKGVPTDFRAGFGIQPDGKILIIGGFQNVNGVVKNQLARLNPDGTLDNSFNYCGCDFVTIGGLLIQPDGKIIVSGSTASSRANIIRLNPDGSRDGSFSFNFNQPQFIDPLASPVLIQPDGKIFTSIFYYNSGAAFNTIYRLNQDGSFDSGFTPFSVSSGVTFISSVTGICLTSTGKILIAYTISGINSSGSGYLSRYNSDGTRDTSFESPVFANQTTFSSVSGIDLLPDGSILIIGVFSGINGISRNNFAKLQPNGNVDLSFAPPTFLDTGERADRIKLLPNGQILVSVYVPNQVISPKFYRFNADGTLDNTFTSPASLINIIGWSFDANSRVVLFGTFNENGVTKPRYARLNLNGSIDSSFDPAIGVSPLITTIAQQNDGKVLLCGDFTQINGVSKKSLARVTSNGSLDSTFDSGSGFDVSPNVITIQTDGKLLVGGSFTSYNGQPRSGLVRLNADGTVDNTFNVTGNLVINAIALLTNGKIVIGGLFSTVNGISRNGVAILNADGSLDISFSPIFGGATIYSIVVQNDNKIMVGGAFTGINGFNRSNLVKLNLDGSLDTVFNAGNISVVRSLQLLPTGKYLVNTGTTVIRLNDNGNSDTTFQSPSFGGTVQSILTQSDGSIIVAGSFNRINNITRNNIVRLTADGSLDVLFYPNGTNGEIRKIIQQTDGKLILAGNFSLIENIPRASIARISPAAFRTTTNFDFDGDGKADIAVFRPNTNIWYILQSSDSQLKIINFGLEGDIVAPADFDGDGKTDLGIFRPSQAGWWYRSSIDGLHKFGAFGANGDIPRPSDINGDGRADFVQLRPQNYIWYRANIANGQQSNVQFGLPGDLPLIGDFNGDNKSDLAIYRPNTGDWWWQSSTDNFQRATRWGVSTDKPVPADYDRDGKTDFAVFRPQTGFWYVLNSSSFTATIYKFGLSEDKPVPADYDGDGKTDIAVFRPSTGIWYLLRSSAGFTALQFGISSDTPIPNAFIP